MLWISVLCDICCKYFPKFSICLLTLLTLSLVCMIFNIFIVKISTFIYLSLDLESQVFILFCWSIVVLQCCVSFRCTTQWFSYMFFFRFFSSPWTEEPVRLQSMGSLRVGHDWETSLSVSLSCLGEGNDNPLQCSCLENPRDSGALWAVLYGVAQSWTWLKWLSSSSSSNIIYILQIWKWKHSTGLQILHYSLYS